MKNESLFRTFLVLFMTVVYFTIAITHIFYLPCLNKLASHHTSTHNSIFKRKTDISFSVDGKLHLIQLPDKSTLEDKRTGTHILRSAIAILLFSFFVIQLWKLNLHRYRLTTQLFVRVQPTYLSFCNFRI